MLDVFQFSNIYVCTDTIHHDRLIQDDDKAQQFLLQCGFTCTSPAPAPSYILLRFFEHFKNDRTVVEVAGHLKSVADVDVWPDLRLFIVQAVLAGYLRRVHVYPVLRDSAKCNLPQVVQRLLDGKTHMDALCTATGLSHVALIEALQTSTLQLYFR